MVRIASLIPSATEITAALGCEEMLVARSHECDFPPSVAHLPACTEAKIDTKAPSAEIDKTIKRLVSDGLSIYRVDAGKLKALAPDVLLTQSQCDVCAVSEADLRAAVHGWLDPEARVVSLAPNGLDDIWSDIRTVAEAIGHSDKGDTLVVELRSRMTEIASRCETLGRLHIACIEWIDPLMSAGNWVPELIAMAGAEALFAEAGAHSPWMQWDDLKSADPDVIVIMPCGFDIARCRAEMPALTGRPGWADLEAVRSGRVFLADGNQYFNRPGPRLVESLEILAEIFHPKEFAPAHRGTGWEYFQAPVSAS